MVILITGASHTGKTLLAQRMLEKYHYPYLSIDHLKMGLIRSGNTSLTPEDDDALTEYLWPIVREIVKTAIENRQKLIVEGCYIPLGWRQDFSEQYLPSICFLCLAMTEKYIESHFDEIVRHESEIETRLAAADCTIESLKTDNRNYIHGFRKAGERVVLIDTDYEKTVQALLSSGLADRMIKTKRLFIRRVCADDWKAIQEIWADAAKSAYAQYDRPNDLDDESVSRGIAKWASFADSNDHIFSAVCLQDSVIGYVALNRRKDRYEIGYCFHSDFQGKGYARESISALLELMKMKGVSCIVAGTALKNTPSVHLLLSLGFRQSGTEKQSFYQDVKGDAIFFEGGLYELLLQDNTCRK